jgi:hypothetical protein
MYLFTHLFVHSIIYLFTDMSIFDICWSQDQYCGTGILIEIYAEFKIF